MGAFREFFISLWHDYIMSPIEDLKGYLDEKVGTPITEKIEELRSWVENVKGSLDGVKTAIEGVGGIPADVIDALKGIRDWLVEQKDGVTGFFSDIFDYVKNREIAFWMEWMQRVKCVSALENVKGWIPERVWETPGVEEFYNLQKEELTEAGMLTMTDIAGGAFSTVASDVSAGFERLLPGLLEKMLPQLEEDLQSDSPGLTEAFDPAIDRLIDVIFTGLSFAGKEVSEELKTDIRDKIRPMIRMVLIFQTSAWLAEWIQPLKNTGLGGVAHALYDTVGFEELTKAYIDPLRLNLIVQPVKYSINELTTPFAPRWGDVLEWYGRGHVDEEEMKTLRRRHGIEEGWDYRYQRMGTKPSSYFMMNAIGREGFWDPDDFLFWLSDAGYGAFQITEDMLTPYEVEYELKPPSTSQIEFLLNAYKQMNIRMTVGDKRSLRKSLFTDGWITREEFESTLAEHKITAEEVADVIDTIVQKQETKDKKELQKAYEKKYLNYRIELDELKTNLLALGLRADYVDARAEYMFARREGKLTVEEEEKILTDTKIINAYKYGQKDKGWAIEELDAKGYTTEDAVLLAESVDQTVVNNTKKEWKRAYESRTLYGRMTVEELKEKYIELGEDAEWAEARAAYIEERLKGKEEEEEEE